MTIPPKAIYRFKAIQIKIPISLFTKIKKKLLKCIWNHKIPQIAKVILIKMSTVAGIVIADCNKSIMVPSTKTD